MNQINKITWLVDTIYRARRITFEEINRRWQDYEELSFGKELPKKTFHNWKSEILMTYGIIIECDAKSGYQYYIANTEELKESGISKWLLDTMSINNLLLSSTVLRERILLENVPSGRIHIEKLVEAMKTNRMVLFSHKNYWKSKEYQYREMPLCLKLYKLRWYLVSMNEKAKKIRTFSLDRIKELEILDKTFDYPKDFDGKEYFSDSIGVIVGEESSAEKILLKVKASQANYIRDLPLHESQKEIERKEDYSIFRLYVHPTYEFYSEILSHGNRVEILEPLWLREQLEKQIDSMLKLYRN